MTSVFATAELQAKAWPYRYACTIQVEALAGARPMDPDVVPGWIATKNVLDRDDLIREAIAETMSELMLADENLSTDDARRAAERELAERKHLVGFARDPELGLFFHGYAIKAAIKEAASVCVNSGKLRPDGWIAPGVNKNYAKHIKNWLPEHIFVPEAKIPLGVREATDVVTTFPLNKRVNKRGVQLNEYINDAKLAFSVFTDYGFDDDEWAMLWIQAEQLGIGAMRSQGFGRFEVVQWDQLPAGKGKK